MLLSDRDILAEIDAKRIAVEPYDPAMVQPSSIDFRLDRFFRLFGIDGLLWLFGIHHGWAKNVDEQGIRVLIGPAY